MPCDVMPFLRVFAPPYDNILAATDMNKPKLVSLSLVNIFKAFYCLDLRHLPTLSAIRCDCANLLAATLSCIMSLNLVARFTIRNERIVLIYALAGMYSQSSAYIMTFYNSRRLFYASSEVVPVCHKPRNLIEARFIVERSLQHFMQL